MSDLVARDASTRGGVEPRAPWAGVLGDARRSRRSIVKGPTRATVRRVPVPGVAPAGELALGADGRIVVACRRAGSLVSIGLDGSVVPIECVREEPGLLPFLKRRSRATGASPVLQDDGRIVTRGTLTAFVHQPPRVAVIETGHVPWLYALGIVVGLGDQTSLRAVSVDAPGRVLWRAPTGKRPSCLAVAPGAQLVVLTQRGLGDRCDLLRIDLATGRQGVVASFVGDGRELAIAPDGTAFVDLGGELAAVEPSGKVRWRGPGQGALALLAGARSEVVVTAVLPPPGPTVMRDKDGTALVSGLPVGPARVTALLRPAPGETDAQLVARAIAQAAPQVAFESPRTTAVLHGLDASSGKPVFEREVEALAGAPRVDVAGRIFTQAGDDLAAFEPDGTPGLVAPIGSGLWDFAFDREGHAVVLRPVGEAAELVIVG